MSGSRVKAIKRELAAGLEEFDVEKLELHCDTKRRRYFRVRWTADQHAAPSWEPEENLDTGHRGQLDDYLRQLKKAEDAAAMLKEECSVCLAELEAEADSAKLIVTLCGHAYCAGCLEGWKDTPGTPSCPLCRKPIAAGRHGSRYMTVGDLRKSASWAAKRKWSQMKL